jgi:hypothetical protein
VRRHLDPIAVKAARRSCLFRRSMIARDGPAKHVISFDRVLSAREIDQLSTWARRTYGVTP